MTKSLFLFVIPIFIGLSAVGQQSFTLEEAVKYATENSNAIKLKDIAAQDANAQVNEFKSIGIPKVNGFVNYQYYIAVPRQPVADFITPSVYGVLFDEKVIPERELGPPDVFKFTFFQPNQLSAGIEASSMLFDGSYLYGVKAAKLYRDLVAQEKSITAFQLKTNVTKAYSAVLIAIENKNVLDRNLQTIEKSLAEVKALYNNGFAESLDVDRLQLSFDNLTTELDRTSQMIELSKNVLKFQMNYPSASEITLTDGLESVIGKNAENLTADAENVDFNQRPEYGLITLGESLNDLDYKRTKAGYLPTARAFASAQGSLQRTNLFDNDETGVIPQSVVGLSVNVPIYDGGDKAAKLQRIRLKKEKTAIEKQDFERSMTLQVKNALLNFQNAKKLVENRRKAVDVNQNIFNKTLIKFKEGVGSSVEVTQAESSLYQAQGVYTNALYDLLTSNIELQSALGKL
jgi:outer membrane protein